MFTFCIENHESFGLLTKNCPKLDKNKSIVSRFSVFVFYKSAVSIFKKATVLGVLILSVDQSWEKIFSNDFALFL